MSDDVEKLVEDLLEAHFDHIDAANSSFALSRVVELKHKFTCTKAALLAAFEELRRGHSQRIEKAAGMVTVRDSEIQKLQQENAALVERVRALERCSRCGESPCDCDPVPW